ncbi:hypothetical protein D9758_002208 [Tetrapyrgos nigripes]|uniref:Ribonuclease T2-like n=1 Tax=Tetrapyrgos nigripes TaxID=182062 RepID=A0A8H5GP39_9AGAR|nr:hypothetical protein D9758_002208 [Tetrapyrgos nigripes]
MPGLTLPLMTGFALLGSSALGSPLSGFSPLNLFDALARDVSISSSCGVSGQTSCHNTSAVSNLCCFEAPGGLLLQTQFWDSEPSTGPTDSWTIHGLWPDNCDGTFTENCDPSRNQNDITSLLQDAGAGSTLDFMNEFWVDINGQNEQFWAHEWNTHGTCYSTLRPSCLPSGSADGTEAVAFFETVTLPTYTWLQNQGITPSSSKTFTLSELEDALQQEAGVKPALTCSGSNLNAISWYFNLKGSVIDGKFVAIDSPEASGCPSSGIKYPLKSGGGSSPTSTSSPPTNTGTPGSLPSKATIHAITSTGSTTGGLLSLGTWSTQTLATYTLSGTESSLTLTSSKGKCGVSSGKFACGSGVTSTTFEAVSSGGKLLLSSGGSTDFSSEGVPSGSTVFDVFTDSSHSQKYTLSIVGS